MPISTAALLLLACTAGAQDGHADHSRAARDAVIAGDLATARSSATALRASLPDADPALREAIRAMEEAPDTTTAGAAVGRTMAHCAACHTQVGVVPTLPDPRSPPVEGTIASAMQAHVQGAAQMWSGLALGDLERVKQGASWVAACNLVPGGSPVGSPVSPLATEQEMHVQDLADRAARADTLEVAASAYGRMLGRCSACHAVTGGGPPPPK